jgi:hypothetical protein
MLKLSALRINRDNKPFGADTAIENHIAMRNDGITINI